MESSSASFSLSKRRKTVDSKESQELELTSPDIELGNTRRFLSNSWNKPFASSKSGGASVAGEMCSSLSSGYQSSTSNESCDNFVKCSLRFVDLKAKSFETEISTCININKFSAETTPTVELIGDTEETASPRRKKSPSPDKPPSQAEIDDFFAVAEKYNYDIVKDVPLDGRYQWIRLKH
ncbi:Peptide methionine sulfoxide reductase msrA [Hibiscus syriacus]|uniref:Peptide methionine sulfoxide reductase msrA n=1 Tax=Hibiscus syriacus TaxID=106335 RepID=A0A6A3AGA3_HIBSY|nr:Peptide methionine sulfoxide reductase msrA [Hibiscus syriacus]